MLITQEDKVKKVSELLQKSIVRIKLDAGIEIKTAPELISVIEDSPIYDMGVIEKFCEVCDSAEEAKNLYNVLAKKYTDKYMATLKEVSRKLDNKDKKECNGDEPEEEKPFMTSVEANKKLDLIDSEPVLRVLQKWNELSIKEAEKAKTVEEARAAYERAPENSVLFQIRVGIYNDLYEIEKGKIATREKWDELSLKEVEEAQTVDEVVAAYERAPKDRKAQRAATKKLVDII